MLIINSIIDIFIKKKTEEKSSRIIEWFLTVRTNWRRLSVSPGSGRESANRTD